MKRLAMVAAVAVMALAVAWLCCCGGCMSIGGKTVSIPTFGTDASIDSLSWIKVTSNGTEAVTIVGAKRNSTETVHTIGNVSMALIGALIGGSATGGTGAGIGAGIGAAGGMSVAEAWQTLKDWMNKSTLPTNTTVTTTSTTIAQGTTTTTGAPVTTTTTLAPIPVAYGAACDAPGEDLKSNDDRWGDYVPVSFLSISPDQLLGNWAQKYLSESRNSDGSFSLAATPTFTGPSGKVYVFRSWRIAHSDAPDISTTTVSTSDRENVSRGYYQAHNAK